MRFNQSQSRAIDHFRVPSLVLAGPGSGKTAVITYRVKNLIEKYHIPPCKILVLTFSKAAAREMEERFFSLQTTDVKKENRPVFGTFHGFFFSVLRSVENNGQKKVLSSANKRMLLQEACIRLHIDQENHAGMRAQRAEMLVEILFGQHVGRSPFIGGKEDRVAVSGKPLPHLCQRFDRLGRY